jgi:hypothetical protein
VSPRLQTAGSSSRTGSDVERRVVHAVVEAVVPIPNGEDRVVARDVREVQSQRVNGAEENRRSGVERERGSALLPEEVGVEGVRRLLRVVVEVRARRLPLVVELVVDLERGLSGDVAEKSRHREGSLSDRVQEVDEGLSGGPSGWTG